MHFQAFSWVSLAFRTPGTEREVNGMEWSIVEPPLAKALPKVGPSF